MRLFLVTTIWLILPFSVVQVLGWIFERNGTHSGNENKEVIDVAFWNNRVFLCITEKLGGKSLSSNDVKTQTTRRINYMGAELFEAPWPENSVYKWTLKNLKIKNEESERTCNNLKSTVSIDVDSRGRLFVLLLGSKNCHPRISVIDLLLNRQIEEAELQNVAKTSLRSIVVDTYNFDSRAYVGGGGDNSLIVYSLRERLWWRVKLEPPASVTTVPTTHLALSKKDSTLYLTSAGSQQLFSVDTETFCPEVSEFDDFNSNGTSTQAVLIGQKLGRSSGLLADSKGEVYYYLTRDYAIVRWNSHLPMQAENHDVVLQSDALLPDVRQIFKDSQKNIWALNAFPNVEDLYCTKVLKSN